MVSPDFQINMVSPDFARMMSNQMGIYYANCALVGTSPRDISMLFGRYVPLQEKDFQGLGELYERQIYVTVEQAEDLAAMLTQAVQAFRAHKRDVESSEKQH